MTRQERKFIAIELAVGLVFLSTLGFGFIRYAEWRDANTEPPLKCELSDLNPVRTELCGVKDSFYKYSGGKNEAE